MLLAIKYKDLAILLVKISYANCSQTFLHIIGPNFERHQLFSNHIILKVEFN